MYNFKAIMTLLFLPIATNTYCMQTRDSVTVKRFEQAKWFLRVKEILIPAQWDQNPIPSPLPVLRAI